MKDLMLNSILKSPFGDYWLLNGEFVNKFIFSWLGFVFVTVASFSSCALLILVLSSFDYSLNRYIHFISGAFICLSRDIWIKTLNQYLNDIRENPMDGIWSRLPDDVCIGEYLGLSEVLILHLENRYWVNHQLTKEDVEEIKNIPGICHIRCESYRHERTIDSMTSFL